jgi:hypothetical protein
MDGSGNASASFTGMSAGDLALIFVIEGSTTPPSGWSLVQSSTAGTPGTYATATFAKVLSSGDISTGHVTLTGGGTGGAICIAAWRGPATAVQASAATGGNGGTSLSIPGFPRNHSARAVVTYVLDAATASPTAPTGATGRATYGSGVSIGVADFLPPTAYHSNTALVWTGLASLAGPSFGYQGGAIQLF